MARPERKRRPARGGADLRWRAGDQQRHYTQTAGRATVLGVSPADNGQVAVWSWAPDSVVLDLGTFPKGSLASCLRALLQDRPRAEVFIPREIRP